MLLQAGDDLFRPGLLGCERGQLQHHANGDRVEVGVEEPAPVHPTGCTDDLDVDTVAVAHVEAFVDHFLGQGERLLHPERVVLGVGVLVEAGLLGEKAVHPVARNHHACGEVAVGSVGAHPGDRAVGCANEAGDSGAGDDLGAGSFGVAGQPVVPVGPVGGGAVVGRGAPGLASKVDGEGLGGGEQHRAAPGDPALDGGFLPPVGDQVVEDARVDHPAVHVLAAGERAALDENHVEARTRRSDGCAAACGAAADDDDVDVGHARSASNRSRWSRVELASATMARSASFIIGQWASVLTLIVWSGLPSPLVC